MKKIFMVLVLVSGVVFLSAIGGSYADAPKEHDMSIERTPIESGLGGKVVETMDSGGYTYLSIERDGKRIWAAIPITEIKVGGEVTLMPGVEMYDFKSRTLGRTFESIIFSSGIVGAAGDGAASSTTIPSDSTHGAAAPVERTEKIKVEKASGPNAYTVAELHTKSGELDTTKVVLRGKVVKVTQAIMGKNWVHIQDGSGNSSDGTDDMTVTSQDMPAIGDIVTASGTLYKDKDFGMGYFYSVIIEEATIE